MPSTREIFPLLKQRVNRRTRAKRAGRSYEEQNEYEYTKAENEKRRAGGNPVAWRERQQKQLKKDKAGAKSMSDRMQKEYKDYSEAPVPWKSSSEKKKASWKSVKDKMDEMDYRSNPVPFVKRKKKKDMGLPPRDSRPRRELA